MASKMHAASEEVPPDEEQASRYLKIADVSRIALSLPSDHLGMWENSFFSIGKGLATLRGRQEVVYQRRGSC